MTILCCNKLVCVCYKLWILWFRTTFCHYLSSFVNSLRGLRSSTIPECGRSALLSHPQTWTLSYHYYAGIDAPAHPVETRRVLEVSLNTLCVSYHHISAVIAVWRLPATTKALDRVERMGFQETAWAMWSSYANAIITVGLLLKSHMSFTLDTIAVDNAYYNNYSFEAQLMPPSSKLYVYTMWSAYSL